MTPTRFSDSHDNALVLAWAGTLTMLLAATWRLWSPWRGTPRIAPLEALERIPPTIDFALLTLVAYGLLRTLRATFASRGPAAYSAGVVITTLALTSLMLLDQLRWQPWAYHAALAGLILANSTPSQAFRLLRLVAIAVYAYSAIAKLNAEFAATLGQQMLGAVGLDLSGWSVSERATLALAIPSVELGIAGLLAASLRWGHLLKFACVTVVAMHAATIVVLGPWALGHSLGVLLWNVGFATQTAILFWPTAGLESPTKKRAPHLALAACGLAVLAPALTPLGLWDQWPGWALYAPRGERATLFIHTASIERLPKGLQLHIDAPGDGPWRRVRLDKWALAETAAPIYPQNRIIAAMGLGLIERYALTGRVRVIDESAAPPLSRERQLAEHYDTPAIADAAKLFGLRPGITWTD